MNMLSELQNNNLFGIKEGLSMENLCFCMAQGKISLELLGSDKEYF
jgi:hypothetical protein